MSFTLTLGTLVSAEKASRILVNSVAFSVKVVRLEWV